MVVVKNKRNIEAMKVACKISAQALQLGGEAVKPGITTFEIDKIIHDFIVKQKAVPSFLDYGGYPASACISVNNEVIHGIPSKKVVIKEGDIVSIDVGAYIGGFHGDNAATFAAGEISVEAENLLLATKQSLHEGINAAVVDGRIGDIGNAIETYVTERGYGIARGWVGHGVGRKLHEEPEVPNFGKKGHGPRLFSGMTLAIEPMINLLGDDVYTLDDGWTVVTSNGSLSAHFEHTIVITDNGPVIMTLP